MIVFVTECHRLGDGRIGPQSSRLGHLVSTTFARDVVSRDLVAEHVTDRQPTRERGVVFSPRREQRVSSEEMPAARTSFERYELKYWLPERAARDLARFVEPYLERDVWARAGKVQRNVSLYLDTRGFAFFDAHTSKAPDRIKLRVRGYGDPPTGNAFFEVKRKVKMVSLKERAVMPMSQVRAVLEGRFDPRLCAEKDRPHLEHFVSFVLLRRAEPKLLVGSFREAFASRRPGEDVRMTLDRDICWQPATARELRPVPGAWRPMGPEGRSTHLGEGRVLVEMKFRGRPPSYWPEAIERFGLRREAFSKYVTAVHAMRAERGGL